MPKVIHVKKARKAIRSAGIKVGDSYYWWKFRFGPKQVSKTPPKRQQLTQSDFLSQVYDLEDRIGELSPVNIDDLTSELSSIADDIRTLGDEQQEKLDVMPEALQDSSSSGELLRERVDACEAWADEIEGVQVDEPDRDSIEARIRAEETDHTDIDVLVDEAFEQEVAKAVQAAIDEAQGACAPGA